MNLKALSEKLQKVSDNYAKKFKIQRDTDWYVLKIQEELGEMVASFLKSTGRGRLPKLNASEEGRAQKIGSADSANEIQEQIRQNLEDEIADVLAMTLLFAAHLGIDPEKALTKKWFQYLPKN